MKTRDDYLESIYEKREKYITEQRRVRRTVLSVCIPLTVCIAVGSVIIFSSPRAESAKSFDSVAGSSLNGEICNDNCIALDSESRQDTNAYEYEAYDNDNGNIFHESSVYIVSERASDTPNNDETYEVMTDDSDDVVVQNTTITNNCLSGGKFSDDMQKTVSTHTQNTLENTTTAVTSTSYEFAMETGIYVELASVSVGVDEERSYSSDDLNSFKNAFLWAVDGELDKLDDAVCPEGDIYTIKLILSDGTTKKFKWSQNCLCDESGRWKTISDSQKLAIELAVNY